MGLFGKGREKESLSPGEVLARTESSGDYPQRGAVLYALRGLTGKDGGDSSTARRELLGLSTGDPEGDKQKTRVGGMYCMAGSSRGC